MKALRALLALVVVVALLVGAGMVADRLVGVGIEATAAELVEARLLEVTDDDTPFSDVEVTVRGSALRGLVTGRLARVEVDARGGVVDSVPVDAVHVDATGVAPDGSSVEALRMTVIADAAGAIASQVEPEVAEAVRRTAVAIPPDRLGMRIPVSLPGGAVLADVELLARVADGALVVEPAAARVAGVDLDLADVDVVRSFGLDDELRAGLVVTGVDVRDDAGTAVVEVTLGCRTSCSLR